MRNVEPLCYVFQILQNLIVFVFVKAEPGILHKLHFDIYPLYLDLHFRQAMLPDNDIRCDTILAVIEKDDPVRTKVSTSRRSYAKHGKGGVHTFHPDPWTRQYRSRDRQSWAQCSSCSIPALPFGTP